MIDTSGKQRRAHRRIRGKSDFAAFDDIALYSDALTGGEISLTGSRHGSEQILMLRLRSAWGRAVGPQLTSVTRPAACRQGRITIEVKDLGWKRELERARPEILSRVARLIPDHPIRELTFRLKSSLPAILSGPTTTKVSPPPAALPRHRVHRTEPAPPAATTSTNEDLMRQLRLVMGRYLDRSH